MRRARRVVLDRSRDCGSGIAALEHIHRNLRADRERRSPDVHDSVSIAIFRPGGRGRTESLRKRLSRVKEQFKAKYEGS